MFCKYCGKECKNENSLKQHEIRCKSNPNRIFVNTSKWKCPKHLHKCGTKGKIAVTDEIKNKYLAPDEVNEFLKLNTNWHKGFTIHNYHSSGVANTEQKEIERRHKISHTMKLNPNSGGLRKGSGKGKHGTYKGIYCDSSWELAFLVYYLEHNLFIERCKERRKYTFENKQHIYIPDFVTDEGIVEIKGYSTKQWEAKIKQNPDIKVLYFDDMQKYLDYTITKYGNKYWEVLYEK
jgi:hypothetical protein